MASDGLTVHLDMSEANAALEETAAKVAALNTAVGAALDVKRLTLQPDDALVIRVDEVLSPQMMASIRHHITSIFGERKVLVLGKGMTLDVLAAAAVDLEADEIKREVAATEADIARGARTTDHRFML